MESELVFKALGDISRRRLLDLLFEKDGRSLSELEQHLPMTRFGVMKHLKILVAARLVITRKSGRETLHYLNAVPIQMVYDRWVSKYSRGWASSLTELKYDLEAIEMAEATMAETPAKVFEIYIKTTDAKLWQAITDPDFTEKYYFGTRLRTDLSEGGVFDYIAPDGSTMLEGKVIESIERRKLVTTFLPHWSGQVERETRVTYEIEPIADICRLTLTHEGLVAGEAMTEGVTRGWAQILSSLKSLLETGEPLEIAP